MLLQLGLSPLSITLGAMLYSSRQLPELPLRARGVDWRAATGGWGATGPRYGRVEGIKGKVLFSSYPIEGARGRSRGEDCA